jgi:hypothetical protein
MVTQDAAQRSEPEGEHSFDRRKHAASTEQLDDALQGVRALRASAEAALAALKTGTRGRRSDDALQSLINELVRIWLTEWGQRPTAFATEAGASRLIRFLREYLQILEESVTVSELADDTPLRRALRASDENLRDRVQQSPLWQSSRRTFRKK